MNANEEWFRWGMGLFAVVLGWLGIKVHNKAMESVSREELAQMFTELRAERVVMHTENQASLKRVHERLDYLFRLPPQ